MLKILILVSSLNIGDVTQANAIINAFNKNNQVVEQYQIDAKQDFSESQAMYTSKIETMTSSEKYITLAVGEEGMKLLNNLLSSNLIDETRSYTVLSIHQYFSLIKDMKIDQIVVPQATIDKNYERLALSHIPKITYILTPISLNPSGYDLKKSFDEWENGPDPESKYIIVMLPGDAPDASNKIRYFDKNSARELFIDIRKLWQARGMQDEIIITNGPRTGKYDQKTGKIASFHKYNDDELSEESIDSISSYFLQLMKRANIKYKFYNFAVEVNKNNEKIRSFYKPLLYLAQQKDNVFIIPGESLSMIGQVPLYLTSNKIILFKSSSMNEDHELVANLAFKKNYLSYFNKQGEVVKPAQIDKRYYDDTSLILKDIGEGFKDKFFPHL